MKVFVLILGLLANCTHSREFACEYEQPKNCASDNPADNCRFGSEFYYPKVQKP